MTIKARRAAIGGFRDLSVKPGHTVVTEELRCQPDYKRHSTLGWNQRLSEIACAVALAELERVDELVEMRCRSAQAENYTCAHEIEPTTKNRQDGPYVDQLSPSTVSVSPDNHFS